MISMSIEEDISTETAPWKPLRQEYLVMLTISILSLMVALDATILVPVLPVIPISLPSRPQLISIQALATALHGTSSDAFWAGTSYLLTSAVFQPFIAALSDIFGRQQLLLLSLLFFSAGALICALANDFTILFVGRSIQGIGGGGIITLGQVIFSDIIPLRQRPKYFSSVLGAWAIGMSVILCLYIESVTEFTKCRDNHWPSNRRRFRPETELAMGLLSQLPVLCGRLDHDPSLRQDKHHCESVAQTENSTS
jgi:MFS family permease